MNYKSIFKEGAIPGDFIRNIITKHQLKKEIGAHSIFLGQVRVDRVGGKTVTAIEYTSYIEMANIKFHEIREAAFEKFNLTCLHVYHSLGLVKAGEICLFVLVSSIHRKEVFHATEFIINEIKIKVPIFGKELFSDSSHQWKVNY